MLFDFEKKMNIRYDVCVHSMNFDVGAFVLQRFNGSDRIYDMMYVALLSVSPQRFNGSEI
jgi:hypothetical protein